MDCGGGVVWELYGRGTCGSLVILRRTYRILIKQWFVLLSFFSFLLTPKVVVRSLFFLLSRHCKIFNKEAVWLITQEFFLLQFSGNESLRLKQRFATDCRWVTLISVFEFVTWKQLLHFMFDEVLVSGVSTLLLAKIFQRKKNR